MRFICYVIGPAGSMRIFQDGSGFVLLYENGWPEQHFSEIDLFLAMAADRGAEIRCY